MFDDVRTMGDGATSPRRRTRVAPAGPPVTCAEKFGALATLFREPGDESVQAIHTLLAACQRIAQHECAMYEAGLLDAGNRAIRSLERREDAPLLEAEMSRLFEGARGGPSLPRLSPCAAAHLEGTTQDVTADVAALYADLGFPGEQGALDPSCPCHIANELEFVAHCLRMAGEGLDPAGVTACDFVADHLFAWGIVFAAALTSIAVSPVLRFAGKALEGLLFCEASTAFDRAPGHRLPS